jgi:glycosyltransferase involved in cell wall biosynthesis
MSSPALSVLLPVYNGERFLAAAIESILGQTFGDFEFIIINDGSHDGTGAIIDGYAARDGRIRAFHQENRGLVATLNRGIELAVAPFIARMDADDVALPRRFEFQLARFEGRPDLAVVGGFVNIVGAEGRLLWGGDYPTGGETLTRFLTSVGSPLVHPTVIIRRDIVAQLGGYRSQYKHAEDYDLWLRIHDAGYTIENVSVPVLDYRHHSENVSSVYRRQQALATIIARRAHRARAAGLADPTNDVDVIDDRTIELLIPPHLRSGVEAELFTHTHNMVSLADLATIEQALREYAQLPAAVRRDPYLAHFLMRAARGLWAQRRRGASLGLLVRALVRHRIVALQLLHGKLRRAGAGAVSRAGFGFRRSRPDIPT